MRHGQERMHGAERRGVKIQKGNYAFARQNPLSLCPKAPPSSFPSNSLAKAPSASLRHLPRSVVWIQSWKPFPKQWVHFGISAWAGCSLEFFVACTSHEHTSSILCCLLPEPEKPSVFRQFIPGIPHGMAGVLHCLLPAWGWCNFISSLPFHSAGQEVPLRLWTSRHACVEQKRRKEGRRRGNYLKTCKMFWVFIIVVIGWSGVWHGLIRWGKVVAGLNIVESHLGFETAWRDTTFIRGMIYLPGSLRLFFKSIYCYSE